MLQATGILTENDDEPGFEHFGNQILRQPQQVLLQQRVGPDRGDTSARLLHKMAALCATAILYFRYRHLQIVKPFDFRNQKRADPKNRISNVNIR